MKIGPYTLKIDFSRKFHAGFRIKYSRERKEIEISVSERDTEVEIEIKDKGMGIPLSEQGKIFKDFYRSPEACWWSPSGVGLGLKIVKHIMAAHKGEIRIKSKKRKESTFSLVFPKRSKTTPPIPSISLPYPGLGLSSEIRLKTLHISGNVWFSF